MTLQNDETVYIQENEESAVGKVEESSEEEEYHFDNVHDVEEGTYLSDDELKKLDEEFLPKLEPMDEPEIKDLEESEVGEDPNVQGNGKIIHYMFSETKA